MAARTVREHERKLAADDGFRMPDLTVSGVGQIVKPGAVTLTATYYDT